MNKYQLWYNQIIERAKNRSLNCYFEMHHILPRSLGGGDESSNLVGLTYREHFLAHWLLTKIYIGKEKRSMCYALLCMGVLHPSGKRIVVGWQYELAKETLRKFIDSEEIRIRNDPELKKARVEQYNLNLKIKELAKTKKFVDAQKEIQKNRSSKQEEVLKMTRVVGTIPNCYKSEILNDMAKNWLKYTPLTKREIRHERSRLKASAS